jgi:ATP-binding cassette, subfamily F, member 3
MSRFPLFSLEDATLRHAGGTVFEALNIDFNEGDRVALVGRNGAGKTSLISLLAGESSLSKGRYVRKRGLRIGYVSQFLDEHTLNLTVRDAVLANLVGQDLPLPPENWIECLAEQYGFPREMLGLSFRYLSGGWSNRAILLKEMAKDPQILLLDEPTNHMDVEGIENFERLLSESVTCAVLIVCHDLDLLDRICNVTWFLREGRIEKIALPCSRARIELANMDAAREERRKAQEKEIDRVREAAKTLAQWGKNSGNEKFSRRAKSMEKRVERMECNVQEVVRERHGVVEVVHNDLASKTLVRVSPRVVFSPDGKPLFKTQEFVLRPSDRTVLLGPNGTGKTTLMRTLVQAFRQGEKGIYFHPLVKLGYYDQNLQEVNKTWSLFRFIRDASEHHPDQILRKYLVEAGFPFEDHTKSVEVCSGGEKARLLLLALRLSQPNFLVLDEPTNHLDFYGIEALANDIVQKATPALIVTHNRAFARAVGTRFFRIDGGHLIEESQDSSMSRVQ